MSSKMKKVLIILSAIVAGSFIVAGLLFYFTGGLRPVASASKEVSQSEETDISGIKLINISTVCTPVKIVSGSGKKLFADFGGRITSGPNNKAPYLSIRRDREELNIEVSYPVVSIGFFDISDLQLEIKIPEEFAGFVNVNTTSAEMCIQDIRANELKTESVSGMVNVNAVKAGYIEIKNTSGKCSAEKISAKTFVNTISGEVFLDIEKLSDDIRVQTVSGTVVVKIPENSSFEFDLSSISGEIRNNLRSVLDFADRQSLKGSADSGDFEININTISGSIVLDYK